MSDHYIVSGYYNSKYISLPQKFRIIRNDKLLTSDKLKHLIQTSEVLNSIFSLTDPNAIANILIPEICSIIEFLSPSKKVQCSKSFAPWIDKNFRIQANRRDQLHAKAIRDNDAIS